MPPAQPPVSTNTIAVNTARSSTGAVLPPCLRRSNRGTNGATLFLWRERPITRGAALVAGRRRPLAIRSDRQAPSTGDGAEKGIVVPSHLVPCVVVTDSLLCLPA
jgi:hypothetical protein